MELLIFLGGIVLGGIFTFLPALAEASEIDKNSVHYEAGYEDGYEKGKREAESEDSRRCP